jgi:hypothetical protein
MYIIDLVPYHCTWGTAVVIGEPMPLGFNANYTRFVTIGIS